MSDAFPLAPGEQVVARLRQHWFIVAQQGVVFLFFLLAPLIIRLVLGLIAPGLFDDQSSFLTIVATLLTSAYLLFVLQAFYTAWTDYALDVWIITNQRVMNVVQRGLFHRSVSELPLDRIQDVSSVVQGVLPTFFNFGKIAIETAGEQEHFEFHNIPQPELVAKQMLELCRRVEKVKVSGGTRF